MKSRGFTYYAFISYSHKNQETAKKLQKRLQRYHLPAKLLKSNPELPKKIHPVFIDEANLVAPGKTLQQALKDNLNESNYLIVVCSPESAKSEYVNEEVEYFIKIGRKDHIIPLIIDGVPHSKDPELECFPPALLNLPRKEELLGFDMQKLSSRIAFLKVIATMLELDDEYVILRDSWERKKRAMIFTPLSVILAFMAGLLIWYNIPHYRYYFSYVYKFEKPIGLFEVKSSIRKKTEYMYRFTVLRGNVQMIERVNSAGILVDPSVVTPFLEPPMIRFASDTVVEYYNANRQKIYWKQYSLDKHRVDFFCGDGNISYALPADANDFYESKKYNPELIDQKTGRITRLTLEYDKNGFLVKKMFRHSNTGGRDKKGSNVRDSKGRWGLGYEVDNLGRVTAVYNLDIDGNPMSVRGIYVERYEYGGKPYPVKADHEDKNGRLVLDDRGTAFDTVDYDENFNAVKLSFYDENGNRVLRKGSRVSVGVFTHDPENGFPTSLSYYDTNLNPCKNNEGWFCEKFTWNDEGRVTELSYYNVKEEKTVCSDGYASSVSEYNEDGRELSRFFFDVENKPVVSSTWNAYGVKWGYKDGLMQKVDYVDSEGNLMLNNDGYASEIYEYDREENKISRQVFLNTNGEKVLISGGYAERRLTYDQGNIASDAKYDTEGKPVANKNGVAKEIYEWEDGKLMSEKYFDAEGKLTSCSRGQARIDNEYDEDGFMIWERFYDAENRRVIVTDGYSAVKYAYDSRGNKTSESYYGTDDRLITIKVDGVYCCERRFEYDDNGNCVHTRYITEEDSPYKDMLDRQIKDAYVEYDIHGNATKNYWLNGRGEEVDHMGRNYGNVVQEHTYDIYGNRIKSQYYRSGEEDAREFQEYEYDSFGRQIAIYGVRYTSSGKDLFTMKTERDNQGNIIKRYFLDGDNNLIIPAVKHYANIDYALKESRFDIFGHEIDIWYYDDKGEPLSLKTWAFHTKRTYDSKGKILTESFYNDDGEDEPAEINGFHERRSKYNAVGKETERAVYDSGGNLIQREVKAYDRLGRVISNEVYDSEGKPFAGLNTGVFRTVYAYDSYGNLTDTWYFDVNGKPCRVIKDGELREHHIRRSYDATGNILSLEFFDTEEKPDSSYGVFKEVRVFNAYGLISEYIQYDENERLTRTNSLTYNSEGNKIREDTIYYRADGTERKKISTEYNSTGNVLRKTETEIQYLFEHKKTLEIVSVYDPKGNITEKKTISYTFDGKKTGENSRTFDSKGTLKKYSGIEYDEDGNITKEETKTF